MRQLFRPKPKSFLDAARREWQFEAFAWLLRGCGGLPRFLDTALVLPTPGHFPEQGMKGHAAAAALFRLVRDHAGMADWPCIVEPEHTAAPPATGERIRVIHYPPALQQPELLVAHFAHELARFLVESLHEPPPGGAELYEPAVDLATTFMGFGVFMANSAALSSSHCSAHPVRWDLNECELVHALALFCQLRKLPPEAAEPHLNAHVRKYLRLAMRDLTQFERDFQKLRSVFPVMPIDASECTMPTRHG
ncbi:MAG TPA: hypothetical protein VM146_06255 [Steroidobacteraceae bacterium]|nr:hypothetical protein [Steroidobacteraceae bacterium]